MRFANNTELMVIAEGIAQGSIFYTVLGDASLSFNHLIAEMALKFEISFSPFVQIEHKSL